MHKLLPPSDALTPFFCEDHAREKPLKKGDLARQSSAWTGSRSRSFLVKAVYEYSEMAKIFIKLDDLCMRSGVVLRLNLEKTRKPEDLPRSVKFRA